MDGEAGAKSRAHVPLLITTAAYPQASNTKRHNLE